MCMEVNHSRGFVTVQLTINSDRCHMLSGIVTFVEDRIFDLCKIGNCARQKFSTLYTFDKADERVIFVLRFRPCFGLILLQTTSLGQEYCSTDLNFTLETKRMTKSGNVLLLFISKTLIVLSLFQNQEVKGVGCVKR